MPAEARRVVQISLAESRASAAFALRRKLDLEAERFEHGHGRNADMWFVIADKRVIPKDDLAATAAVAAVALPNEPVIEPLPRVMRQRALGRKAERLLQHRAERRKVERCIGQCRERAADPA